jgi:chromosome partitioning protein
VFDTVIPRNVRLAEAPSYGLPGVVFDPSAKGSQAFVSFAESEQRVRLVDASGAPDEVTVRLLAEISELLEPA